jgi:hypothetical protein
MQRRSSGKPMEIAMTIRSIFKTSTSLAALLALSLLSTIGGAEAESGIRSYQPRHPPIARIPTGPDKMKMPCVRMPLPGKPEHCAMT